jgi:hypothetical protein
MSLIGESGSKCVGAADGTKNSYPDTPSPAANPPMQAIQINPRSARAPTRGILHVAARCAIEATDTTPKGMKVRKKRSQRGSPEPT